MKRQWTNEELEAHFTLHSTELDLVGDSKTDYNLLGFAVLLKYFQYEGRFPSQKQDPPVALTRHIAHQLGVATEELLAYDWDGRMIKNHRAAYQHHREQHIEPPTPDRLSRLLHTALHQFEIQFCAPISQQLTPEVRARLDALLTT